MTPLSSLLWQPGAEMSGLMRPSSAGPQLVNDVIESSLEFVAPTVMWFFAHAGGAVVLYWSPQRVVWRSLPFAQQMRMSPPRAPRTTESMTPLVTP